MISGIRHFNINLLGLLLAMQAAVKYLAEWGVHRQNCGRDVGEFAHLGPAVSWILLDYLKR